MTTAWEIMTTPLSPPPISLSAALTNNNLPVRQDICRESTAVHTASVQPYGVVQQLQASTRIVPEEHCFWAFPKAAEGAEEENEQCSRESGQSHRRHRPPTDQPTSSKLCHIWGQNSSFFLEKKSLSLKKIAGYRTTLKELVQENSCPVSSHKSSACTSRIV